MKGWSIRKKLILFLLIATVVPFIISNVFTYQYTKETVKNRFISTNYQVVKSGSEDLSTYLQEISDITPRLYGYYPFIKVLQEGVNNDLGASQLEVRRTLSYLFNTRPEIRQLHLYIENGQDSYTVYNSKISSRKKYEDIYSHSYYARLKEKQQFLSIEPTHKVYSYNNLSTILDSDPKQVISFHHMINEVPSNNLLGFLSIDIDLSKIKSTSDSLYNKEEEDFYLINDDGMIMYSSNQKAIGTTQKYKWIHQLKNKESHSVEWEDSKFSGVLVYDKLAAPFDGWHIVKRIPYSVLYEDARRTALINVLIGLPFLLMIIIATLIVSVRFTEPIRILIQNMKEVEKGSFVVRFKTLGNDEFGMLGQHFKSMVETINDLIKRKYRLEIENKSTQLKVLQSQVNPHFLYNAFQSIGTLALKHKAVEVYKLLTLLSNMMRYSMNMKEDIVTLTEEVNHAEAFLALQKQRFGSKFSYEFQIDERLKRTLVPKMILQPLVENSFKHGFETRVGDGKLTISASLIKESFIQICVRDNGKGMNDKALASLHESLAMSNQHTVEHIGLQNIADRLLIYYENAAKMEVESKENEYFTVTMILPLELNKGDDHNESPDC
ncbi:sensor histidine kinase [Priestia flexa]|uniref:sensor histidine kinase n=1 Tax=Priestia flexa TaxID=86664 RepID=UPI000C24E9D1|nr:sensor histidine kinase [Priestia flexa]MEC0666591.1 sensor histidine kinase [Priestia flexa]MED3824796.1 sensor histidine kinase [Priestia flexa]